MAQKTSDVLRAAWRILRAEAHWIKGNDHVRLKAKNGRMVDCYCTRGAVMAATHYNPNASCPGSHAANSIAYRAAMDVLEETIPPKAQSNGMAGVVSYNDSPKRRHSHIRAWFARALQVAVVREAKQNPHL